MSATKKLSAAPAVDESAGVPLAHIVPPRVYQARRSHLFTSPVAFDWWVRKHRPELVSLGALLKVAGHVVVNEPVMDDAVLSLGQAAMTEQAAA